MSRTQYPEPPPMTGRSSDLDIRPRDLGPTSDTTADVTEEATGSRETTNDASSEATRKAAKPNFFKAAASFSLRGIPPLVILGAGVYAFLLFSVPEESEPDEEKKDKLIRTSATQVLKQDYQITVESNGVIQPHNEVTLSSEVSGRIVRLNPLFATGAYFKEGDVLLEIDAADYKTAVAIAESQVESDTAALKLAEQTFTRLEKLLAKNTASEAEAIEAEATRDQMRAQLDTAKAQLVQAKRNLDRTIVRAPFDGRVRTRAVGLGQTVTQNASLGIVFAVDYAEVRLPISAEQMRFLELPESVGDSAITVELRDAVLSDSEHSWTGQIVRTEGTLDINSLEVFAVARIDDPFGLKTGAAPLRIGQPVVATVPGKVLHDVRALPRAAVNQLDRVNLIDSEMRLRPTEITPIWSDRDFVVVEGSQLEEGSLLATTKLVYAPVGAEVEIVEELASDKDLDSGS